MAAKIISGTEVAKEIRAELTERVAKLKEQGVTPGLAMIRVGEDPASISYVTGKEKAAEEIGVWSETTVLPEQLQRRSCWPKSKRQIKPGMSTVFWSSFLYRNTSTRTKC
jgi:methylenetetrahydrofolate dehydrogenase (NADP+)/methenyltetrahydrofolate cyclohydrolase